MVHSFEINGLHVLTGDLICTVDGGGDTLAGEFWRLVGKLIPGDVDHIAVYIGPGGRCVEAGAKGRVITFDTEKKWNSQKMSSQRGGLIDVFYGIAYPLARLTLTLEQEDNIREDVASFCLQQAEDEKPYNLNFLDSDTDDAFYCSQLAYRAYLRHGINLNTNIGVPKIPGTESIIFPQEIWNACKIANHNQE